VRTQEEWQWPMRANNQHAQTPLRSLGRAIGAIQVFQQLQRAWDTHQLSQQRQSKHHLTMPLLHHLTMPLLQTWQ